MKGIIIKNWLVILRQLKINAIVFILAAALILINTLNNDNASLSLTLVMVISSSYMNLSLVIALAEYSNRNKWESYSSALPSGRRGSVWGMYMFALSYFVIASAIELIIFSIISLSLYSYIPDAGTMASYALALLSIPMIHSSLTLPFLYKLGFTAYRAVTMISVVLIIIPLIFELKAPPETALFFILFTAAVLLFLSSMLLSERLYKTVEI